MFLLYTTVAAARFKQKHVTNLYKHTEEEGRRARELAI